MSAYFWGWLAPNHTGGDGIEHLLLRLHLYSACKTSGVRAGSHCLMIGINNILAGFGLSEFGKLERNPNSVSGDAAALSAGTAGAPDRVPLELSVYGLFCLLNIFELALVPTTFLNLGLIEVVEDFVERQSRAEDTPYAIDAPN